MQATKIKEMSAPDILLNIEADLLKKRFSSLTAVEIFTLSEIWPKYYEQQLVNDAIDDEMLSRDLEKYLMGIN